MDKQEYGEGDEMLGNVFKLELMDWIPEMIGWYRKFAIALIFSFLFIFSFENTAKAAVVHIKNGDNLQHEINQAGEGDKIVLEKGTYKGSIKIVKSLTLNGTKGAVIKGNGKGNVITVRADDVVISGLTIQGSGRNQNNSGIFLEKTKRSVVKKNILKNVQYGIYIKNGKDNCIVQNEISSFNEHFSKRGNGIHIFKGNGQLIKKNKIHRVQDGIYFDFANNVKVEENDISHSRYGMHYMFSQNIHTKNNTVEKNITGFMIMDSKDLQFLKNKVFDQFHFRGVGILIYETSNVLMKENEIVQNSIGLSLEKGVHVKIRKNVFAANQVGLQFLKENVDNVFTENNFIANIVSSTIGKEKIRLDDGKIGNYWDDYKSYDIDGNGVGEVPYKAGSLYDHLLKRQPLWQFFFESPTIILWSKAESMFPSLGSAEVYDNKPLVQPVNFTFEKANDEEKNNATVILLGFAFMIVSLFIIVKGRNDR